MRPRSRVQLVEYCLRALGHPVIEINVDDDQLEDRVDEALQVFAEYHFDGVEKVYLKYRLTQNDINNGYISLSYTTGNQFLSVPGASGNYEDQLAVTEVGAVGATGAPVTTVNIEDLIVSVLQVFHFSNSTINMFDVRYQYALNDLYSFGTIDLVNYTVTQSYLSLLRQMLSPEKSIRFSRRNNKLYIDMNWNREVVAGNWIIIEAWRVMDAKVYPEIYDDMFLKKYVTALFKRQWGANLSKFKNIQMPGGITFNGDEIWNQANEEIKKIEEEIQSRWETGPEFLIG